MPPKKQAKDVKGAMNQLIDEDLSDAMNLPLLHDFIFTNIYTFKYRKNLDFIEKALLKEFYVSGETAETVELARTKKVIQLNDLISQAKAKSYLTDEEVNDFKNVDPVKARQALARTTNELLAGYSIPLRRQKLEEEEKFQATLETMDEDKRKEAQVQRTYEQNQALKEKSEFQCWLKDFPKTFEDFAEMRRSATQHQPEVETVMHGAFLIQEKIPVDFEEEDDPMTSGQPVSAGTGEEDPNDPEVKRKREQFDKQERIDARKFAIQLNRYANNCPTNSGMRLLTPVKMLFCGPDPPMEREEPDAEKLEQMAKEAATNKNKKATDEPIPEVEVDPQIALEDKMYEDFAIEVQEKVKEISGNLAEFRIITNPITGYKKMPLFPKVLTLDQQLALNKAKEAQKSAEEESKRIADSSILEKQAPTKPGGKQPSAKQAKPPAGGKPPPSQQSNRSATRPRTGTSVSELEAQRKANDLNLAGVDDQAKNWNFSHYNKVMQEMKSGATSVGSILAAMIYQVEEENKNENVNLVQPGSKSARDINTQRTMSQDPSGSKIGRTISSMEVDHQETAAKLEDELNDELDNMYKRMTMEHAVVETAFRHMFQQQIVNPNIVQSPYQSIINEKDDIKIRSESYTFLNGLKQGQYEQNTLKNMELPGINDRIQMPPKETRSKSEREADTAAIIKYCDLPESQTKRLITLKYFEDLVRSENPERTYNFLDRNFIEHFDPATFRQVMVDAMRRYPDMNTAYYDKEDALLIALNFKNPPGRLLRRQWTYPFKVMPDFQTWRECLANENSECTLPKNHLLDIESHRVGLLRTRQKFCFPCDDSVIRVDKNYVAGRRFGSSVVCKDSIHFGIRERDDVINEKVAFEDELVNMDTRKDQDRRCEFWLEFENGVRMHAEMLDEPEVQTELIPPVNNQHISLPKVATANNQSSVSIAADVEADQDIKDTEIDKQSQGGKSILKSTTQIKDKEAGVEENQNENDGDQEVQIQDEEDIKHQEALAALATKQQVYDPYDENKGACITFTYKEGLVAKILPNGDIAQNLIVNSKAAKKFAIIQEQAESNDKKEVMRTVTRNGVVIRKLQDGTQVMYFQDGTITELDTRRGIWKITNSMGIVRERNLRQKNATDQIRRLEFSTKRDAETNAQIVVREDGLLKISYVDKKTVLVFPDHSKILITKEGADEESATVTSVFSQEGYARVQIINNPIKARASTVIGMGGTDALMGNANIMERSHGGLVSMLLLPDQTVVETYLEKQELKGYNRFCRSLIHLVKRSDLSVIKVRQDGEIVIISTNERKYLNSIGNQLEFGKDYDYFFELFGVPTERRSGVYTVDLDQGRLWSQDEEGNFFIVYANGDSCEKLSVSFNLDQMVEGIQNKEPSSPRIPNGEYIENECKFLPPPKTVAHPRLFVVNAEGAMEFSNQAMLDHTMHCYELDEDVIKKQSNVKLDNEDSKRYKFLRQERSFNPENPNHNKPNLFPKMPQSLDMVNETASIANDPDSQRYYSRDITEYKQPNADQFANFRDALVQKDTLRDEQEDEKQRLKVVNPQTLTDDEVSNQCKIMLRIAKARGIAVQTLLGEEYKPIKQIEKDQLREAAMASLDDYFMPGGGACGETGSSHN